MTATAVISDCGLYRYHLTRTWGSGPDHLTFVMLNPSTADADVDDPTIRRCMGFAKREGCSGLIVVNLFALRATKPLHLDHHPDPVGPHGDRSLLVALNDATRAGMPVVAAWGADPRARSRGVGALASTIPVDWRCLGTTKAGAPRHPLYVKGDQPLVSFCEPSNSEAGRVQS